MGARCCCEETHETNATMIDLSKTQVAEQQFDEEKDEQYDEEKNEPQPMPVPTGMEEHQLDSSLDEPPKVPSLVAEVVATPLKQVDPMVVQAAHTFTVDVEVGGRRLGFGIGHKLGLAAIEVVKVHEDGIIPEWNRIHYPEKQIVVGCKIVSLNGRPIVAKDRDAMLSDITEAVAEPRLRMEVENP
mmetsp:Transcript_11398/g.25860  ORF Transcript_11398/g.25860 Transcript_11398/m.25860 type:complete len:186 (-) Transcript_11398:15-572(-)|eukprot:6453312-Amphidinium_carterae.1